MKSLYYRSQIVSSRSLIALAAVSIATIVVVEAFPHRNSKSQKNQMTSAAARADVAFRVVRGQRSKLRRRTLRSIDPAGTGLLGPSMSQVTSLPGHLKAKQTSANANFAAVALMYLQAAGAKPGDHVAIGCTGSFPALNIAVLAAAETLNLKPVLISSAASSQFGANDPALMWPDMERSLVESGALRTRSLAVSRGGFRDSAAGMTDNTRLLLDRAIGRGGRPMLASDSLQHSIDSRAKIYKSATGDLTAYVAYINVGGGSASVGGTQGNDQLGRGLIHPSAYSKIEEPLDSVASRFLRNDVPVINMIDVVAMARQHGLPVAPEWQPEIGQGDVYDSDRYRSSLALIGIFVIVSLTSLVMRPPALASMTLERLFPKTEATDASPQWMV